MISLITISCIAAAFAPVVSRRLQSDTIRAGSTGKLESNCSELFGEDCKFCGDKCCYICDSNSSCAADEYKSVCKCACVKCNQTKANGGYGEGCVQCDNSGCTKCQDGDNGYYLKDDKTCAKCTGTAKYSNGLTCYASCEATLTTGYLCKNGKKYACSEVFDGKCTSCEYTSSSKRCKTCAGMYYLETNGLCQGCMGNSGDRYCGSCSYKDNCTACWEGRYLTKDSSGKGKCVGCDSNCYTCSGSPKNCTGCTQGKFITNAKTCADCTLANCAICENGSAANSQKCNTCKGGYYKASNGTCQTCSSKFGTNCMICDLNKCISCSSGSYVENATANPACKANNTAFNCSDKYFMRIGNLCVTRRNMGDAGVLTIPATVNIMEVNTTWCTPSVKCCFIGRTAGGCTDTGHGEYGGCNRTVCNGNAAEEICAKFNYGGLTWRLPKRSEVTNWYSYSAGVTTEQGLGLCSRMLSNFLYQCNNGGGCLGSNDSCYPPFFWCDGHFGNGFIYRDGLSTGTWSNPNATMASVRCVADMPSD